jgi:quinoprotein glucose dehydrogenase
VFWHQNVSLLSNQLGVSAMPANPQLSAADLKALVDFLLLRDRPEPVAAAKTKRPVYSFAGYPRFYDQEGYPANKPPAGYSFGTVLSVMTGTAERDIMW